MRSSTLPQVIFLCGTLLTSCFAQESTNKIASCGGSVDLTRSPMTAIFSPNYPSFYPPGSNCNWIITAGSNKNIRVYAFQFDVESAANCQYDSLTISETFSREPLGKFCGRTSAISQLGQSSTNSITLQFVSDYAVSRSGFYLLVMTVDGANNGVTSTITPTSTTPTQSICPAGTQNCPGALLPCIRPSQLCDGTIDCAGGSDEANCAASVCGKPQTPPLLANKIVGGKEAIAHSWPWQVAMATAAGRPICGASIIANRWILTAAHCCKAYPAEAANYLVRIGMHNMQVAEPYARTLELESLFVHPSYIADPTTVWDYCLLKTKQVMTFNDHVQPVCLATATDGAIGSTCYVAGWGNQEAKKVDKTLIGQIQRAQRAASPTLYQTDVAILSQSSCNTSYGGIITNEMLCAAAPGHDSCQGDSGGPLVCQDAIDPSKWKQVGVVSWGWGCAQPQYPGVYSRVTSAASWIAATMQSSRSPLI